MDQIDFGTDFDDYPNDHDDDPLYDYYQDIARSSFDDMVNDHERNQLYFEAIHRSIAKLRENDPKKSVNVIDIGSGTGLLSMMAIKANADHVIACECFEPMAKCSKKIIEDNYMSDKIDVINQRSEFLEISKDFNPNLLVAELLDTELIGENCISIYRDLIKRKLVDPEQCLCVPARGRIWIQLVQSEYLFRFHQFRKSFTIDDDKSIEMPLKVLNCFGSHLLHDIQLNRLRPYIDFEALSDPMVIFEFEFNNLESLKQRDHKRIHLKLKHLFDKPMMLFAWWDIDLDDDGEITLSCGPYWTRGFTSDQQVAWREHWMQTIYYFPAFAFDKQRQVNGFDHDQINRNQSLMIDCYHDSVSFWFDLPDQNDQSFDPITIQESESWFCHCGLHSHLSRIRLQWLNNEQRYQLCWKQLNTLIKQNELHLIYFGDESLLPIVCSLHSKVKNIWIICNDRNSYRFFSIFPEEKIQLCTHKDFLAKISESNCSHFGIISDLHFRDQSSMISSMDIFRHLYRQREFFRNNFDKFSFFLPNRIVLRCLLVKFEHLWKCYAPVMNVKLNGDNSLEETEFNLIEYDLLIMNARQKVDWQFDRRSLWEYRCWPLSTEIGSIIDIDLNNNHATDAMNRIESLLTNEIDRTIEFNIEHLKSEDIDANTVAIVCWIDQYLNESDVISGGIVDSTKLSLNEEIEWVNDQQQLVTFLCPNDPNFGRKFLNRNKIELKFRISLGDRSTIRMNIL